ncbi:hypothetical protein ACRXCV_00025 (plasmid) [Halobacteriovorax sp. GFR7]|uniref:hypothetical protein n=1 Tax=unclassified Halobacteriovorax TaxID=2639665 RepID=UPI003D950CF2
MDNQTALALATALGAKSTVNKHNGVALQCPLAPWTHAKGTDSKPSAAILTDHNDARFNCFTCCQQSIGLLELVMRIGNYQATDPKAVPIDLSAARNIAIWWEEHKPDPLEIAANEINQFGHMQSHDHKVFRPWGENYLTRFLDGRLSFYAYERGLTDELIDLFEIKYDQKQQRLVQPYRTFDGQLAGCHGRLTYNPPSLPDGSADPEAPLRYYSYANPFVGEDGGRNPQVWMGENLVDVNELLVLTEGQFDQTQIYKAHPNVLASRSASISAAMFNRIKNARYLVSYYDVGTGGDLARQRIMELKSKYTKVYHLHPLTKEGYDDAGETPHELIAQQLQQLTGGWL